MVSLTATFADRQWTAGKHLETAGQLAKELEDWNEVKDLYKRASELYMYCGKPQAAADALVRGARCVSFLCGSTPKLVKLSLFSVVWKLGFNIGDLFARLGRETCSKLRNLALVEIQTNIQKEHSICFFACGRQLRMFIRY